MSDLHTNDNTLEKPAPGKPVLAWDGDRWVRAYWVPKHYLEQGGDSDDWTDYSEEADCYYWPEGWYELQTHGGDALQWFIHPAVTAWQPMPAPPAL